jgi:glycosyltransferase involved in cell wall biosynthesis
MTRTNLHLFITDGINESRLFKEASNSLSSGIFEKVILLAMWDKGLDLYQIHASGLEIIRKKTVLRLLKAKGSSLLLKLLRPLLMALALLEYAFAALRLSIRTKPSDISVHNPIMLPVGMLIKLLTRCRLVYLPHELEAERAGMGGLTKSIFIAAEGRLIRYCDYVVVVCEPIAQWYCDRYRLDKVAVVRNVPQKADVAVSSQRNAFRTAFSIPETCRIFVYQGLIERERGCASLVAIFRGRSDHLVFMGYGEYVSEIKELASANIHHHPAVPLKDIVQYTSGADIGLFVLKGDVCLSYALSLPNKFFEYLHAGLPVIVSNNLTYLSSLVREHGLGWVTTIETLDQTLASITQSEIDSIRKNVTAYAQGCVWENDASVFDEVYSDA